MTAIDMQKMDRDRQARIFEAMMESFLKRWEPHHQEDRYAFHAELHSLIRQVYRDAQEPLFDQITKMASAIPMFPQGRIIPDGQSNTHG